MGQEMDQETKDSYKVVFDMFDQDKSGSISRSELENACSKLGVTLDTEELERVMKTVDEDGNDQIEFDEFLELMKDLGNQSAEDKEQELIDAFNVFDMDGDGFIEKHELKEIMEKLGTKLDEEELEAMIKAIDEDGDGKVNYQEFLSANKPN